MSFLQNNKSSSTNVHEARIALGARLRELRQRSNMTGRQLAESLHWQASKVSRLENGKQTPSDADITAWTRTTGSEQEKPDLLATLHTLEVQHAEWQRQLRTGLKSHQSQVAETNAKTRMFRVFECTYVPGLLQTSEYARSRFEQSVKIFKVQNDVHEAVKSRMQRQDILYRPEKRFHFVLTEAVLRYRLCSPEVMLGQLDRLLAMTSLPNVKLGIIPFETTYVVAPSHGFWLLDTDRVMVETFSAELNLAQPQETKLYGEVFDVLATAASYHREARSILNRAIEDLAQQLSNS
ncbi:helix-turn-helix protein [Tamaricihabitans halophyticus]|uniref:Helix-turn-helix protein n=2 Tax=Tamaricihabitans halophyticus TaxID=1262583 RepID=A0A4R2Q5C1_9PSEU|nr:helix-turn-helix transcriptional regulator [Tamaricihabitans halophyticus]TCP43850.1 helix-turn-helix protein [Tamaricihabitans halophyticus]